MTTTKLTATFGAMLIGLASGCQTTPHRSPPVSHPAHASARQAGAHQAHVPPQIAARPATQVVEDFDQKREEAEYASALARWEEGDSSGCRAMLTSLLQRRPEHREANLLFAELCLLEDSPTVGLVCAERVCRRDPSDAQAQHTRGLLLEAMGRHDEAVNAYELAVKHAPRDEIYLASLDAACDKPSRGSLFIANEAQEAPEEEVILPSPRPTRDSVRLTGLRGDDRVVNGSAMITDE